MSCTTSHNLWMKHTGVTTRCGNLCPGGRTRNPYCRVSFTPALGSRTTCPICTCGPVRPLRRMMRSTVSRVSLRRSPCPPTTTTSRPAPPCCRQRRRAHHGCAVPTRTGCAPARATATAPAATTSAHRPRARGADPPHTGQRRRQAAPTVDAENSRHRLGHTPFRRLRHR